MNRQDLIDALSVLEPVLAGPNETIQIFKCFWFGDKTVTAYNGRIAIQITYEDAFKGVTPGFRGCVDGKAMLGLLRSSAATEVNITEKGDFCILKTKVRDAKLATLPIEDAEKAFPFPEPKGSSLDIPATVLVPALVRCLCSTTNSTERPDQLGVTFLPMDDGNLHLYSTNNETMTRAVITNGQFARLKKRVILPDEFCRQAVSLLNRDSKKPVDLQITSTYALLTTDKATLYGSLIVSEQPIDFVAVFEDRFPEKLRKSLVDVPKFLPRAIDGCLTLAAIGEGEARMTITCENNRFKCSTKAVVGGNIISGTVHDAIFLNHPDVKCSLRPGDIKPGLEHYPKLVVTDRALCMCDDEENAFLVAATNAE